MAKKDSALSRDTEWIKKYVNVVCCLLSGGLPRAVVDDFVDFRNETSFRLLGCCWLFVFVFRLEGFKITFVLQFNQSNLLFVLQLNYADI